MNKILKPKFHRLCVPIIALLLFITSASAAGTEETITVSWEGVDYFTITIDGCLGSGKDKFILDTDDTVHTWTYWDVEVDSTCIIEPTNFGGHIYIELDVYNIHDADNNEYTLDVENWSGTQLLADGQALHGIGSFPYDDEHKQYYPSPDHPAWFNFGETHVISPTYGEDVLNLRADTLCLVRVWVYGEDNLNICHFWAPFFIRASQDDSSSLDEYCGDNLTWTLDKNGTLYIEGAGAMYDYSEEEPAPWYDLGVRSVIISDEVTYIGARAFARENRILSVSFGNGVKEIGEEAFVNCGSLSSVTIPDSVETICSLAFAFCDSLHTISLGAGLEYIGTYAFWYCSDLTHITIPDSVRAIHMSAFANCSKLSTVSLSQNIIDIKTETFEGCTSLSSITIPEGVKRISSGAFAGCSSLKEISLPDSLTVVAAGVFRECHNLKTVHYAGSEGHWYLISIANDNEDLLNAEVQFSTLSSPGEVSFSTFHTTIRADRATEILTRATSAEPISVTISAEIAKKATTMLVPVYDENGRMIDFKMVAVTSDGDTFTSTFTFSKAQDAASMNILLLDANWNPVAENLSIKP